MRELEALAAALGMAVLAEVTIAPSSTSPSSSRPSDRHQQPRPAKLETRLKRPSDCRRGFLRANAVSETDSLRRARSALRQGGVQVFLVGES